MAGSGSGGAKVQWCVGVVVVFGLLFAVGLSPGQEVSPSIEVTVNQSRILELERRSRAVSVAQPEIAEVVVLSPNRILINGKSVGTTSLIVSDERGAITNFNLIVVPDVTGLQRQLRAIFPDEQIEVSASGPALVLRGTVSNEVVYDKVLAIAQTYLPPEPAEEAAPGVPSQAVTITSPPPRLPATGTAFAGGGQLAFLEETSLTDPERWPDKRRTPGLIDLLVIGEFRQIQLNVTVAEVSLTKLREIGFDFSVIGDKTAFLSLAGSQAGFPAGPLFGDPSTFPPTVTFGGGTSAVLSHVTNNIAIATVYRLFQNKDITDILAQPKLVIKNGRSGGFLAGGEFPFPVPQASGIGGQTFTIEFKPFGVRLDFLPTLTWSNTIDLRVFPEVSEIDPSVSVSVSGLTVPGLRVRRSVSRVEMKEGDVLVLSGLLDRRTLRDVTKFPFLGDIPILGALFRSTRFRDQETELIFVITPNVVKATTQQPALPSGQKYMDPDMRQVPLPTPPPAPAPSSSGGVPTYGADPGAPAPGGGATIP